MAKKILWMVVSGLMVLSLVMAACGPAEVEEEGEIAEEEAVSQDMPKYGGVINFILSRNIRTFDEAPGPGLHAGAPTLHLTNDVLTAGDWTKGPAGGFGTNETGWDWGGPIPVILGLESNNLAESYEIIGPGHWIFHIRPGVRYATNPDSEAANLVGGREFDANDAAFALNRYLTSPGSYIYRSYPGLREQASVTAPDRLTLEIKVPPEMAIDATAMFFDFATVDTPPEVIEKYGDMTDWKNSVGTGPFILTEFVSDSNARLIKNPDFWMKDPIGPGKGNQLPYVDGLTYLIVPDLSTRLAALRTGKVDQMSGVTWEDGDDMKSRASELQYLRYPGGSVYTAMRTDKAPFDDVRVRRALIMAIDYEAIVDSLFGGTGAILTWPLKPNKEFLDAYLSLEEAPASIKELYAYNPEKARGLLAEAGYPEGFKTSVVLKSIHADYMSVIKDMWSKVGVELTLDVKETGAFNSLASKRDYEALIHGFPSGAEGALYQAIRMRGEGVTNQSYVDDPKVHEAAEAMQRVLLADRAEANRIYKELMKYVLDQVWMLPGPQDSPYTFWWPWLKNYSGELHVGYFNAQSWAQFIWLDLDMKKEMGY